MKNHRQLPILWVVQIQNSEFERFWIEDQDDRVWTGERFDSVGGSLFADLNDAALEVQNILKGHFEGAEPRRYVVPLVVEVYSHDPVSVAEIAHYLSRSSRLQIDSHEDGNGPGNSLVLPRIEWHRIQPEKESSHE